MNDLYVITTLCLLPLIILTMIVGAKVRVNFNRYDKVQIGSGLTAADTARKLLDNAGLFDVQIEKIEGKLTDNYNPKTNVLSLSDSVYDSKSVAAAGIAAHEVGHAVQKSEEYVPLKMRSVMAPVCSITSRAALPLLLVGFLLEIFISYNTLSNVFFFLGVGCYALYTLFTLMTLPVEFNASRRARAMLVDGGFVAAEDEDKIKSVLNAAAMTYVMSFALSLVQLLRLIAIFGLGRRRR